MSTANLYLGCKIALISKAKNRYEGILYTIDKVNSTVVLAKVKCFGTEERPTDRPTPPKDDIYEYITFRGTDIMSLTLCESPRSRHGLPQDPAIVQSSSTGTSDNYLYSSLQLPAYNQLAASSLLNQQYAAAFGLGPVYVRRVEKAVQTIGVERARQRRGMAASQEQHWERRGSQRARGETYQPRRATGLTMKVGPGWPAAQQETSEQQQQHDGNNENRPPLRRRQGARRRRNRSRGQLMMGNVPSAILKFDTDFDFDSSNAQFIKEELEREVQNRMNMKDGSHGVEEKERDKSHSNFEDDNFGPKCYYNKAKSFFDNISSDDNNLRLTWAEERKRNLETFGVPGRFQRSQGFRGGYTGQRAWRTAQTVPTYRTRSGQL